MIVNKTFFKAVASVYLLLASSSIQAQCSGVCGGNLISNPSFELTTGSCGTMNPEIFTDYSQVQDWYGTACETCPGNGSTPDYYNSSCTGATPTENCNIGTASVGFFTSVDVGGSAGSNAREYVQTPLTSTLVAGQEYCATIQVKTSPASFAYVPTDGLGLWFTDAMVDIDVDNGGQQYLGPGSIVNATPQIANPAGNIIDTICTTITGTFIATGTESWLVMGNFRPDNMIQTTSTTCGGFFAFCFGYLIVDQIDVYPICSSCNATITASGPFCVSDPAVNLTATDPGGTWSGNGITDAVNGTFDPAVAGVGSHQIIYDLTCGDADTIMIDVLDMDDASFNYTTTTFCENDADPAPTISGLTGGTFSIDGTGVINATTGVVDLSASGSGSYTVTYTTNGSCPNSSDVIIDILPNADATIDAITNPCVGDPAITLTAAQTGGVWSGVGITNTTNGTFDPATAGAGTHMVYYEISGACGDIDSLSITVNDFDDASFNFSSNAFCASDTDPVPTVTGLAGGTFTINSTGVINATSGEVDLSASGVGNFTITYTTNGTCPNTSTFDISITNTLDATISAVGPFCQSDPALTLSAVNGGGVWSGNGITDVNAGTFDPATAGAGTHQIIYTISGSCGDADTIDIVVNASDNASISYSAATYCESDADPLAMIMGTIGGTFSIDNGGVINSGTGQIDLSGSGNGTFTITYITPGACPDTATTSIVINAGQTASIVDPGVICISGNTVSLIGSPAGGTWSGTGITDPANGVFDPNITGEGTFTVTYSFSGSCSSSDSISINVYEQPNISLPPSYQLNYGESALLTSTASGNGVISWSPSELVGCDDCEVTSITPLEETVVCVSIANNACLDTACTMIYLDYDCGAVGIPTAFMPGSDDANGQLCVLGNCVTTMYLRIYNRWGELVFESVDPAVCWDGTHMKNGKPLSTGVFVYQLEAQLIDGTSVTQKGNITLFR